MERRTLVRLLVVLAIGIPVLVEAVTFLGLVEHQLLDGGDGATGTPTPDRVGVGDELLPETTPVETVTGAEVQAADTPWLFVLTVEVDNRLEVPYELQLTAVVLDGGEAVRGEASSGRVAPGTTGQVTAAWELPEGATPRAVEVRTVVYGTDETERATATVDLAKVPVRGG